MTRDFFPAGAHQWLAMLADGWRFADDFAPDFTAWNAGWPVVLLVRSARP